MSAPARILEFPAPAQRKTRYVDRKETLALIRAALRAAFPACKFSVRCPRGSVVDVRWTDGPTDARVREITEGFRGEHFDGMTDSSQSVAHEQGGERIHYGIRWCSTHRALSTRALQRAAEALAQRLGIECPPIIPPTEYLSARCDPAHPSTRRRMLGGYGHDFGEAASLVAHNRDRLGEFHLAGER